MRSITPSRTLVLLYALLGFVIPSDALEPPSLLTMIGQWQYPGSKMTGSTLSDAATINNTGDRTVQSIQYKTVLITKDSVTKVLEYYKSRLMPGVSSTDTKGKQLADFPRSVTFHEDSEGRSLSVQIILINTEKASTTMVISRAETETETHIAWTHYLKL